MDIKEFIKQEMQVREMSYEQLASYIGVTRQNLWDKLNKRAQPNFGNVRKILEGLDYDIVIVKKTVDSADRGREFMERIGEEQISYEAVEELLSPLGYELKLVTHKNEENVNIGIDNSFKRVKL
ncbi:MAG TPA: helix-turn-helix domain-containing protein [Candidatus Blautia faecipullorum]|nr:helix-turn-helix domain-containing protein [Candidatus Blautia faecipullorum]